MTELLWEEHFLPIHKEPMANVADADSGCTVDNDGAFAWWGLEGLVISVIIKASWACWFHLDVGGFGCQCGRDSSAWVDVHSSGVKLWWSGKL